MILRTNLKGIFVDFPARVISALLPHFACVVLLSRGSLSFDLPSPPMGSDTRLSSQPETSISSEGFLKLAWENVLSP